MDPPFKPSSSSSSTSLFQVYLRLRPPFSSQPTQQTLYPQLNSPERFLTVEAPPHDEYNDLPTHITIHPPSDSRKRAVEKFAFTKVFEEQTSQLDIFNGTGAVSLVEGVLKEGRDGLLATLGVTGSGKTHTILGSKAQRGLTQLSVDLLFRSLEGKILYPATNPSLVSSLAAVDAADAQIQSASAFLDGIYGDGMASSSRAATPMTVGNHDFPSAKNQRSYLGGLWKQWSILGLRAESGCHAVDQKDCLPAASKKDKETHEVERVKISDQEENPPESPSHFAFWNSPRMTRTKTKLRFDNAPQDTSFIPSAPRRNLPLRPSALPYLPDISKYTVPSSQNADYAILVSMYEVYNDRIFDLLSNPRSPKDVRRRPLLFKSTEGSPDRKVVAGLRKIVCGSYEEAILVLETGLMERRVAGTGSNNVSSRSHGFFCIEAKKRPRGGMSNTWTSSQLTIVDLAGSERARNAKTAGATLAEAGKINESLMYLGQCLQMQSDYADTSKPTVVPFRQCKLTELLFSNSFPSTHNPHSSHHPHHRHNPQRAVMIVTADPIGDFNATSQILRYSALAREVTVPRIPSVASIVFQGAAPPTYPSSTTNGHSSSNRRPYHTNPNSGRTSPNDLSGELEVATTEISRLGDEVEILTLRLAEETVRRREAERGWRLAEEKAENVETEVREECWGDMEKEIQEERRRWMDALGDEAERNDERLDRKLEISSRGIQIHEDPPPDPSEYSVSLERENEALRCRIAALEREIVGRSPSKKPLKERIDKDDHVATSLQDIPPPKFGALIADEMLLGSEGGEDVDDEDKENVGIEKEMRKLDIGDGSAKEEIFSATASPKKLSVGRKVRKLTPRMNVGGFDAGLGIESEGEDELA